MADWFRQELVYFFSGLSFYTRIPCPAWVQYSPQALNKSRKYLPLIGLVIGGIAALVFWLSHNILPASVSIALSMVATVYFTGAFHEDGLADCADGFGGGWEKAHILTIMKDSRIGTYGTISLVLILGLKFLVLFELQGISNQLLMLTLVMGHSLSRLMASLTMQFYDYVSESSTSKSKSVASLRLSVSEMVLSVLPVLVVLVFIGQFQFFAAIILLLLLSWYLARNYQKRIGGYTGDCLGATQQLSEVFFYLILLVFSVIFR